MPTVSILTDDAVAAVDGNAPGRFDDIAVFIGEQTLLQGWPATHIVPTEATGNCDDRLGLLHDALINGNQRQLPVLPGRCTCERHGIHTIEDRVNRRHVPAECFPDRTGPLDEHAAIPRVPPTRYEILSCYRIDP